MLRYRTRRQTAMIPTASMADIAFLLIIFFMYSTTFSVDRTSVELPASVVQQMVEKDAAIIAITSDNQINISDGIEESKPIHNMKELEESISDIVRRFPGRQFIIKCDRNAPYRYFDKIYEFLLQNKVQNVALLTVKKSELGSQP